MNRIGEEKYNNQGCLMKIIKYNKYSDIDVKFEDGTIVKNKTYQSFKNGQIKNKNLKDAKIKNRLGEDSLNNQGLKMKIIEYKNSHNIDVKFENEYIARNKQYNDFLKGNIRNPYFPEKFGIGYIGEGEYSSYNNKKREHSKEYNYWATMLQRCYDEKYHKNKPTYTNCTVCDEWHNFQNFAKWFNKNYYEIDDEQMCLDKDIICHNLKLENKIYSPKTCLIVPQRINSLFIKKDKNRGEHLIGVYKKSNNRFIASVNSRRIGIFNTEIEAFNAYKKEKEKIIKNTADEYKYKIPQRLYEAMYSYQVEITD